MKREPGPAVEIEIAATDGYRLRASVWRHENPVERRSVVVINAATSVCRRYYARFASFLHEQGFDVLTYDYRGIGDSRSADLRGFNASWIIWGNRDFEGVLQYVMREWPGRDIDVVAHSVGGFVTGLAPSGAALRRVFTVGAQLAYWRDFKPRSRVKAIARWQVAMPLLTALFGYFPGKRLGWLEDTPKGVVQDWCTRMRRIEGRIQRGEAPCDIAERRPIAELCGRVTAPIFALGIDDDEFGTHAAIERLLGYFPNSRVAHRRLAPADIAVPAIGHFAFFHSRFEPLLWDIPFEWLKSGQIVMPPVLPRKS